MQVEKSELNTVEIYELKIERLAPFKTTMDAGAAVGNVRECICGHSSLLGLGIVPCLAIVC